MDTRAKIRIFNAKCAAKLVLAGVLCIGLMGCGTTSAEVYSKPRPTSGKPTSSESKKKPTGHYETKTVIDQMAWPEIVVDQKGYTETVQTGTKTVVDEEAWDDYIPRDYCVCGCGAEFDSAEAMNVHMIENQMEGPHASCTISFRWDVEHHPAVTHEEPVYEDVCHPPMTHTVVHPAKTHTEKIWVEE